MRRALEMTLVTETLRGHSVSKEQLLFLQNKLRPVWEEQGIYFDLTDDHFVEQLNRRENRHNPISFVELDFLLTEFTNDHTQDVSLLEHNTYGVIREPTTCTNLVFFVDQVSKTGYPKDVRLITILRKKDFHTPNQIYEVKLN